MKLTKAEQARRFEEMARELECDEDPKAFEKAFGKIVPPKPRPIPAERSPSRKTPKA